MKIVIMVFIALVWELTALLPAFAQDEMPVTVTAKVEKQGDNYKYTYTVHNEAKNIFSLVGFEFPLGYAKIESLSAPKGWNTQYNGSEAMVSWECCSAKTTDDATAKIKETAILPGKSVDFSFISKSAPGTALYTVFGFNPTARELAEQLGVASGSISAPMSEPEAPSTKH